MEDPAGTVLGSDSGLSVPTCVTSHCLRLFPTVHSHTIPPQCGGRHGVHAGRGPLGDGAPWAGSTQGVGTLGTCQLPHPSTAPRSTAAPLAPIPWRVRRAGGGVPSPRLHSRSRCRQILTPSPELTPGHPRRLLTFKRLSEITVPLLSMGVVVKKDTRAQVSSVLSEVCHSGHGRGNRLIEGLPCAGPFGRNPAFDLIRTEP